MFTLTKGDKMDMLVKIGVTLIVGGVIVCLFNALLVMWGWYY